VEEKERVLEQHQSYRNRKKLKGICVYCTKPADPGVQACSDHRKKHLTPEYKARKNARRRQRKREDPAWAMADRLRKRVGRAIRDYAPGMKAYKTQQYLGCTMDEFMRHIESRFVEGMTWDNRHLWHLDHIKPCVMFNLMDPEEQKKCFHYTNLQPLWAIDNIVKHDNYETTIS
jgi:hypothetical protein